MWLDKQGRSHSVAMDDPGRLLSPELKRQILGMDVVGSRHLLSRLNEYLPQIWLATEGMVAEPDEADYVNVEPPGDYVLVSTEGGETAESIVSQVAQTPLRWRSDVIFAAIQFILFEAIGFDEDDDTEEG